MKAKTIEELIKILQTLPQESTWYGWDDGSINISNPDFETEICIETAKYDGSLGEEE